MGVEAVRDMPNLPSTHEILQLLPKATRSMINSPPLAISRTLVDVTTIAALVAAFITMEGCSTPPVAPTSASVSGTQQSQAANPDWQHPSGRIGGAVRGDMPQSFEIEPLRPFLCCTP